MEPLLGLYLVPSSNNINDKDVNVSAIYNVVIPMINTLIYSLRNWDIILSEVTQT
jgi:olfactory receptor